MQFYGGIDQGFIIFILKDYFTFVLGLNPTITSADYGLLPGDILLSVNGVPIREHTYNQIKESINSSVVLDRKGFYLQIFYYRFAKRRKVLLIIIYELK